MNKLILLAALAATLVGCAPMTAADRERWNEAGRRATPVLQQGLTDYSNARQRPVPYPDPVFCSAVTNNCALNVRIVK